MIMRLCVVWYIFTVRQYDNATVWSGIYLQFVSMIMRLCVVWCGRLTLWRTGVVHVPYRPVCHYVQTASKPGITSDTTIICSAHRQVVHATVGMSTSWEHRGKNYVLLLLIYIIMSQVHHYIIHFCHWPNLLLQDR